MKWNAVFLGIILFSILLSAVIPWMSKGMWWDEVVYVGLSKGIGQGFYSLDPSIPLESFRPPLFPFLLAPLPFPGMKILVLIIAIISIVAVYKLSLHFGKQVALLSTLFFSTSTLFVFFSTKLLTEPLFIIFLSLSLLYFFRWTENNKNTCIVVVGVFSGLAFLTRYLATILILSYAILLVISLFRKKSDRKALPLFFLPLFLILTPWFFLNSVYYGSPLEGYFVNYGIYAISIPQAAGQGIVDILFLFSYLTLFILAFFLFYRKKVFSKNLPLTLLLVLTLAIYVAAPHKEPRYLLSFLPLYTLLAALGVKKILEKYNASLVFSLIIILSLTTLFYGIQSSLKDVQASSLVEASLYLKGISSPEELILTQSYPFVYVLSERKAIPYCPFPQQEFTACQGKILAGDFSLDTLKGVLQKYPIHYILSYKYEPANPKEARDFFEQNFQKVATFEQWGDPEAVVIYRV